MFFITQSLLIDKNIVEESNRVNTENNPLIILARILPLFLGDFQAGLLHP